MNIELLRKIKAEIVAEPDAFRMDVWTCGTAHCIAGWAIQLSGLMFDPVIEEERPADTVGGRSAMDVAAELLHISDDEAMALFLVSGWPDDTSAAYDAIPDELPDARQRRAAIAADLIDAAITSGSIDWVREPDDDHDDFDDVGFDDEW